MHHSSTPQLQLKSCSSSFAQHLPQAWRWLILWDKWKGTPQKIDSLLSPLRATPRTDTERAGGWPSSPCAASALAQRAVDGSNVLSMHCISTHIPSFAHGRGQTPYLPLEISLET